MLESKINDLLFKYNDVNKLLNEALETNILSSYKLFNYEIRLNRLFNNYSFEQRKEIWLSLLEINNLLKENACIKKQNLLTINRFDNTDHWTKILFR